MAEKKKILYIVEAMGGGVFTYIVDLLFAAIFIVMYVVAVSYGMTQNEWYDAIPYHFYFDYM